MKSKRQVKDAIGKVEIPEEKIWGAATQRAVENFPISHLRFSFLFYEVFFNLKKNCALVNAEQRVLDPARARAIAQACDELLTGKYKDQFPVDVFQTGSGTSTNMNVNEVISFLASRFCKAEVHPNDHVNKGQSSNDVFPTVIQVSSALAVQKKLIPATEKLVQVLQTKSQAFKDIIKVGRTHLQDAAPLTLGQEFSGYSIQILHSLEAVQSAFKNLLELPLGGTAVGTGLNSVKGFGERVAKKLSKSYKIAFKEAGNHFEAQSSLDRCVHLSGSLKGLALSLYKIANDLRWYSSGPQAGIGELVLPAVQPGSSIMPGKVNPVIPEAVLQVCAKVIGNDTTITWGAASSQFQLNTMMPIVAYSLMESVEILTQAIQVFTSKCVKQLGVNKEKIAEHLEKNVMLVTSLVPSLGYDKAAEIAKHAMKNNQTVLEAAQELCELSEKKLREMLDPRKMLVPSKD